MSETFSVGPVAGERWAGPGPTVVLLHAGVADRRFWYPIAPSLAQRHDVLAYDRTATGRRRPRSMTTRGRCRTCSTRSPSGLR